MYDLATKMEYMKSINETTTMSNIAYLPSGFGTVKTAIKTLAKLKKDWNIQILESPKNSRTVVFEDQLSVQVPLQYWKDFNTLLGMAPLGKTVNLEKHLTEAFADELDDLRSEIKPVITSLFDGDAFDVLDDVLDTWKARFGNRSFTTPSDRVAISIEYKEKDIQKLVTSLVKVYGEDKGNLELFIEAVKDKKPLNTFEGFRRYEFLYGSRINCIYFHTSMIFEVLMDMSYISSQSIYFPDKRSEDILDRVSKDTDVKVVKSVVYPGSGRFTEKFFGALKDIIEEVS
jgi:hypothetical protein